MDLGALGDDELALAFRAGDQRAYEEIVRRHQGRVYAVAYRMTGNREDALDVAQDALLKVYRKIEAWQPHGGFVPWLMRLVTNQSIDLLRRRKRRQAHRVDEAHLPGGLEALPDGANPGTDIAARVAEIDARIQSALAVLSDSQRAVFVMRHYEGLALAEIAEVQGCTVGSVKVHLFRALKKLKAQLGDLKDDRA